VLRRSALALASSSFVAVLASTPMARADSPIAIENAQPVTMDRDSWLPTLDPVTFDAPSVSIDGAQIGIDGYPSSWSLANGDTLGLRVSTRAASFRTRVYRIGWYANSPDGPVGSRLVYEVASTAGVDQPLPPEDARTGLAEAKWRDVLTLRIPDDWVTGHYVVRFTTDQGKEGFTHFVVRDDARAQKAPLLYVDSLATAMAYDPWPKVMTDPRNPTTQTRGKSTYAYNSAGVDVQASGAKQAVAVSFDRPHGENWGLGIFRDWTVPTVQWLEMKGYDVAYASSIDLHVGTVLAGRKAWMNAGHDEYWSREMWDNLQAARDRGVSLAFFSGNDLSWQVRFEAGSGGAYSTMVAYKTAAYPDEGRCGTCWDFGGDPEFQAALAARKAGQTTEQLAHLKLVTYSWAGLKDWDPDAPSTTFPGMRGAPLQAPQPIARPPIGLEGLMNGPKLPNCASNASPSDVCRGIDWVVDHSSHWIYTGAGLANGVDTGLHDGDRIPMIVGYEMDNARTGTVYAARPSSQVLLAHADQSFTPATGSAVDYAGQFDAQYYRATSGAHVFAAGTINWPWALSRPGLGAWGDIPIGPDFTTSGSTSSSKTPVDVVVSAITSNVLSAMLDGGIPDPTGSGAAHVGTTSNGGCSVGGDDDAPAWIAGALAALAITRRRRDRAARRGR
jgi:MYXO-CTERM domain-containing protein